MRTTDRTRGLEARAAWYVARLYSGEMTGMEEDDLMAWVEASPSHHRAYSEALALWDAAGELCGDTKIAAVAGPRRTPVGGWRARGGWIAAAVVFLAVAVTLSVISYFDPWGKGQRLASYQTAIGEQRLVSLEDGSRVMLNTGSRVLIDYTRGERRIILDFGEVFFEIEKDPNRPLTVATNGRLITVLGTKFSVRLAGGGVKVTVLEGVVAVGKEENRFPLKEGQAHSGSPDLRPGEHSRLRLLAGPDDVILPAGTVATFARDGEQIIETVGAAVERQQSWRSGAVRFENEPLYQVVAELNRYSKAKILIEDDAIVNLPISGVFRLERVDVILDALEDVIPIEIVRYPDRYALVGSDRNENPLSQAPAKPATEIDR